MCTGILLRQRRAGPSSNPAYTSKGKKKRDSTKVRPGIRLRRRYPHSTPGEQAPRSPSGVCAPASLRYARRKVGTKCDLRHQNKKGTHTECPFVLEVQAGFEPADNGVADRGLTTWLLHQRPNYPNIIAKIFCFVKGKRKKRFCKKS